jgi:hypothetical protein
MGKNGRAWDKRHSVNLPPKERIQIIQEGMTRQEAIDLEISLIAKYGRKDLGTGVLHNRTNGGDGTSLPGALNGMWGKKHSPESLDKIKKARAKQVFKPKSEEWKAERKKLWKTLIEERGRFGPEKHSPETIEKLRRANKGKPGSKKLVGVPKSEEHKKRISEGRLKGKKAEHLICSYCTKECDPGNYSRWHGEKCRFKIL